MTSIQALNSPITSVIPGVSLPTAALHKTLVIDVTYSKPLLGKPRDCDVSKKCLVLDLDETLVHSTFQPVPNADLIVPVHLGEGVFQPIYVCKRPGVDEFLRAVSEIFEVVLFTASLSNYADPVIDFLDPTGGIRYRLYREDCLQFQGMYIKDLSRLGRDLDQILIVDNSPASYSMQPQSALSCRSWFKDLHDRELQDRILPMLISLSQTLTVSQWRSENLEMIETPYRSL
jgi:RNA polymerase II subunit A small phosphatase-like protein